MTEEAKEQPDYPSFITCRVGKNGVLSAFNISAKFDRALEWREEDIQKKKQSSENSGQDGPPKESKVTQAAESPESPSFASTLDRFTKSIRSFYDLVGINHSVRNVFPGIFIDKEFDEYRKSSLPVVEDCGDYVIHGIPESQISTLNLKVKRYDHLKDGIASLPASVLMGLIARYDANISGLVRFLLQNRKERLAGNDRTILVKDILSATSFDELVASLIDDEIHSLMRGSHEDQVKYIEDNFSIKIRDGFKRWPEFIEVFERRNLAAHGEGTVNARYVKVCTASRVSSHSMLALGEPVKLNDHYLRHAIDLLLEFGILLVWWLWLKQAAADAEAAYNAINDVTYDLIVDKRYRLAARVLESALSRKTEGAPEVTRRMMAVNLANCQKKVKNDAGFEAALKLFDWTASADAYRISVASLTGDIDQVCALMPRVSDDIIVGKSGFRDWPVFDWVRGDERVKECFKQVFGEPLELASESGRATDSSNELSPKTSEISIAANSGSVH